MASARSADLPAPETQSQRPAAGDVPGRQTDGATSDVQPVAAKPVAAPAARTRLQLRFADDSFASVADADHRLLYGLQRKGSKQDVSGRPPLRIVLGNARAVSVSVDGKSFRIPTDAVADNEARFEVGAAANPPADAVSE
jgi:cytoskeleton protein RodZ